jgi:glycosyltransferase involved in cell wall biosynthesis
MNHIKTPLVSVLIPAYNEEKYIGKTLDAIFQQDYPKLEVIVVNNASTDKTSEEINRFIEAHLYTEGIIKVMYEEKQGTNFARECGRKAASGSIIAQLDADCLPDKHWISKGVCLLQMSKAVAITGPYDYSDTFFLRRTFIMLGQVLFYPLINKIVQFFKRGGIMIGGNSFINANILDRAGGYNVNLTFYGDDVDTARKISAFGKIKYSSKLTLKTSSRRFTALGFNKVQKRYRKVFWDLVFLKGIKMQDSIELTHPR